MQFAVHCQITSAAFKKRTKPDNIMFCSSYGLHRERWLQ